MLLTIDPSSNAKNIGWAIFENGVLKDCGKGSPSNHIGITQAVIEHPVIYPNGKTRNPNDIVKLAVAAGEQAGLLWAKGIDVRYVEPRAWKYTLDKDTCCRRVYARLSTFEQAVALSYRPEPSGPVRGGKDHVLDAIGIGLNDLGRWRT